jgi:hypothetical protein
VSFRHLYPSPLFHTVILPPSPGVIPSPLSIPIVPCSHLTPLPRCHSVTPILPHCSMQSSYPPPPVSFRHPYPSPLFHAVILPPPLVLFRYPNPSSSFHAVILPPPLVYRSGTPILPHRSMQSSYPSPLVAFRSPYSFPIFPRSHPTFSYRVQDAWLLAGFF